MMEDILELNEVARAQNIISNEDDDKEEEGDGRSSISPDLQICFYQPLLSFTEEHIMDICNLPYSDCEDTIQRQHRRRLIPIKIPCDTCKWNESCVA